MNTSGNASATPLSAIARRAISAQAPTDKQLDSRRLTETSDWLNRIADGHRRMTQNEAVRQVVAERLS